MTVNLNPEQERVVGEALLAGLISDPNEVVALGVDALQQRLGVRSDTASEIESSEWERELHEWIQSHSRTTPVLPDAALERD